jgi:hypothetical protein
MNKFENYIRENRLRLDSEELGNDAWKRIEQSFITYNRHVRLRRLYAAAAVLILLTVSTFFYLNHSGHSGNSERIAVLEGAANYYRQEELSNIRLISGTEEEIRKESIPSEYEDMFKDFTKQLQIIDKQYQLYKTEIAAHGYSPELIQQVIFNYQLKLSVLQMFQAEIDKINNLTKNNYNGNKKTRIHI